MQEENKKQYYIDLCEKYNLPYKKHFKTEKLKQIVEEFYSIQYKNSANVVQDVKVEELISSKDFAIDQKLNDLELRFLERKYKTKMMTTLQWFDILKKDKLFK